MWVCRVEPLWHLKAWRNSLKIPWLFSISSSYSDSPIKKSKLAPLQERRMIDRFRLHAKGGDGGSGCHSVRRSRQDRHGRADGGNGGRGGDVILECSHSLWDFSGLQHHVTANRGGHGTSKNKIGTRGSDKVVQVPVGTVIHLIKGEVASVAENQSSTDLDPWEIPGSLVDDLPGTQSSLFDPNATQKLKSACDNGTLSLRAERNMIKSTQKRQTTEDISQFSPLREIPETPSEEDTDKEEEEVQYNVAELTEEGQRVVIACGGEGGLGSVVNSKISKLKSIKPGGAHMDNHIVPEPSDENQSSLSSGLPGSEAILILELKSIADVGFVGMPNAGKSTLLGAISRAKPTVGHYAFTTLRPNLGNLNFDDLSITVADIPGLIKGAHEDRGLGHAFLRHIERTRVLAYVLDLASGLDGRKGIPPWEQLKDLVLELEHHQQGLSGKPSLVVANKIDEDGAEQVYEELKMRVEGVPIFPVCAVLEEGISEVKAGLKSLVNGDVSYRLGIDKIMVD